MANEPIVTPSAIDHVRITVTDIRRSKAFYQQLFGDETAFDFSDEVDEPGVIDDRSKLYGGVGFTIGDQLFGLRPVGSTGGRFDSTKTGLDHIGFRVGSREELESAAARLDEAGIEHGEITDLGDLGMVILSVQDPDDINIELSYASS